MTETEPKTNPTTLVLLHDFVTAMQKMSGNTAFVPTG